MRLLRLLLRRGVGIFLGIFLGICLDFRVSYSTVRLGGVDAVQGATVKGEIDRPTLYVQVSIAFNPGCHIQKWKHYRQKFIINYADIYFSKVDLRELHPVLC